MRNFFDYLGNFGFYLLPVSLLTLCSALLIALFYSPVAPIQPTTATAVPAISAEEYWRAHTEEMIFLLLSDALRQAQAMQETQARTLMYHRPFRETPSALQTAPLLFKHDAPRPMVIRL
ncbi:MAG: hypothetical protein KDI50_01650 [Candidatus Competibacteraceae bacterium]|nr:hypothetical protein [Candidatus Competibacteraceae bacterium]